MASSPSPEPARRLPALRPGDLDEEQRALRDRLATPAGRVETAVDGSLHGPFDAMLRAPRTGTALAALGAALRYDGVLPDRVRERAVLAVAAHHRSAYEWHAHAPLVAALEGLDPHAEQVAVDAVDELLRTGDLTDDAWARTVAALGEAGAVELTTLVGYYSLLAVQMRVLRVPLPDGAPPATFGA
ncbi:carboxymuconolactone decarboxylase family protein [Pseudonocardia sp. KRD-184]|uniref:Carboxymuconolactone decarboxylase family protein n=1 Tax=Pseudonocardia oceani TaxID=2792013 RepID=A0ABS6U7B3_9PSEU|nr:carboxymuconolactone decarboxylase family protein [Pseudonocardia oceani]MBW0088454.1 carboxymuconolactone decarboxylase family protein [Pseudonocardia oceani]MBW0095196.1 carboxymuconolactone decarboxylase family protein [Pseudonocardia oceani]MBW0108014.1 carboxymuconolactone decarboxylase family protein [Pseudonocardia oceani]MBW0120746.1 carboxymuconolactone decarboxylase family protein [Pseudonocardia oceani]MBW0127888.1 carboxymuconolactone decarboxylase family protein [Pseudonocardia